MNRRRVAPVLAGCISQCWRLSGAECILVDRVVMAEVRTWGKNPHSGTRHARTQLLRLKKDGSGLLVDATVNSYRGVLSISKGDGILEYRGHWRLQQGEIVFRYRLEGSSTGRPSPWPMDKFDEKKVFCLPGMLRIDGHRFVPAKGLEQEDIDQFLT